MKYSFLRQNRYCILLCEGHRYSRYMTVYNKEYWRCTDRTCKGKVHMSSGRIVYNNNGHSHRPDHKGISAEQALMGNEEAGTLGADPLRQIYDDSMKEYEEKGHGPIRQNLPYSAVVWEILQRVRSTSNDRNQDSNGDCTTAAEQQQLSSVDETCNGIQTTVNSNGVSKQANETECALEAPKVELEVIDCTAENNHPSLLLSTSSCAHASPHFINKTLATTSHLARVRSVSNSSGGYNCSSAYNNEHGLGTTTTTQANQRGNTTPGLTIHNTYSLQTTTLPTTGSNQQDGLQGIVGNHVNDVDMNMHEADSMLGTSSLQHSGNTSIMQVNCGNLHVLGLKCTELNSRGEAQSFSSTVSPTALPPAINTSNHFPRPIACTRAASQPTAARQPLARPNSNLTFSESTLPMAHSSQDGGDDGEQTYRQFQMQLAKKEHQLRIHQMKEKHKAEMELVRLQQELIKEQLRKVRQLRGGVN